MDFLTTVMICSMFHANNTVNAIIQTGSHQNSLAITRMAQVGQPGQTMTDFKTPEEASAYAKSQLALGNHVNIGMMQIPSGWLNNLSQNGVSIDDLMLPCKNVAVATDLLNQSEAYCSTVTNSGNERDLCTLSFYETGDPKAGLAFAQQVLDYAAANPMKMIEPGVESPHTPPNPTVDYNSVLEKSGLALPQPTFSQNPEEGSHGKSE